MILIGTTVINTKIFEQLDIHVSEYMHNEVIVIEKDELVC
jgi:predicted transcriptional regulator